MHLLHILCALVVIVWGLREMQSAFIYRWENAKGRVGENHEACKRWMRALITVMAIVAFHLPSLKHLITLSSWWCKFLPRLITHTSCCYWVCSKAVRRLSTLMHSCMQVWHAPAHKNTCTTLWQVAMTGHPAAVTRSERIGTLLCPQERWAELS